MRWREGKNQIAVLMKKNEEITWKLVWDEFLWVIVCAKCKSSWFSIRNDELESS
jgi:hypothetical protein